jgi:hypothetical protein
MMRIKALIKIINPKNNKILNLELILLLTKEKIHVIQNQEANLNLNHRKILF